MARIKRLRAVRWMGAIGSRVIAPLAIALLLGGVGWLCTDQLLRATLNVTLGKLGSVFGLPSSTAAEAIADARAQFKVDSSRHRSGARLYDDGSTAYVVVPSAAGPIYFTLTTHAVRPPTRWQRARVSYVFPRLSDPTLALVLTSADGAVRHATLVFVERSPREGAGYALAASNAPVVARLTGLRLPASFVARDGAALRAFESAHSLRRNTVEELTWLVDWGLLAILLMAVWGVWAFGRWQRITRTIAARILVAWLLSSMVALVVLGLLPPLFGPYDIFVLVPWLVGTALALNVMIKFSGGSAAAAYRSVQYSIRRLDHDRLRLARDLHDHGQPRLSQAASRLASLRPGAEATAVLPLLRRAMSTMAALRASLRVRPSSTRALREAVSALGADLAMDVEIDGRPGPLPGPTRELAYAVIVESVANAHKHAHARRAAVRFSRTAHHLTITVVDDGAGMAASATSDASGLAGLRDRIEHSRGQLNVGNRAGAGVEVQARLPVRVTPLIRDELRALGSRPLANAATAGLLAAVSWEAGRALGPYLTVEAQIAFGLGLLSFWIAGVALAIANSDTTFRRLGWAFRSQNIVANLVWRTVMRHHASERHRLYLLIEDIEHTIGELADGVGQLAEPGDRSDAELMQAQEALLTMATELVARVRAVARQTYPPYLRGDGLVAALHELAERAPIHVDFRGRAVGIDDQTVALSVHRIAEAALSDATRLEHRSATLTLTECDGVARVQLIARGGPPGPRSVPRYKRRWQSLDDMRGDGLRSVDDWDIHPAAARILALDGEVTVRCDEALLSITADLPAKGDASGAEDGQEEPDQDTARAARVLVIDGDSAARERIRVCLTAGGHRIAGEAWDADQGVQVAAMLEPEIVILSPEFGEPIVARLTDALAPGACVVRGRAETTEDRDDLLVAVSAALSQRDAD